MRDVFNLLYQVNRVSGNHEEAEDGPSIEEIGEQVPAMTFDDDLKQADLLFKRLLLEEVKINEVGSTEFLTRLSVEVETKKHPMENQRTAVLWMQYIKMIDILQCSSRLSGLVIRIFICKQYTTCFHTLLRPGTTCTPSLPIFISS